VSRTVSAVVTLGPECLGSIGPLPVDVPWWAEVGPVAEVVEGALGVPVTVLRLLTVEGGEGARDGHVTYHVEAGGRPSVALRPAVVGIGDDPLRLPWATAAGLAELLAWASGVVPVTGRPVQHKSWNLAALLRLPVADGVVWLKATPPFAADEAAVIAVVAGVDPGLAPRVLASAPGRLLLADLPGEDLWQASDEQVTSTITRWVAAQAAIAHDLPTYRGVGASGHPDNPPAGAHDRRVSVLAARVDALLDGPVGAEVGPGTVARVRAMRPRWAALEACGLPDTLVHGDFHPGNWRGEPGHPPVVLDFADAYWGNPVQDGLRAIDYLPAERRPTARKAWVDAWRAAVPDARPEEALEIAEPLAHLADAVRYQEFLDGIEPSERIYHLGDPAAAIHRAVAG
jgi:phosphotransferase family enzyme